MYSNLKNVQYLIVCLKEYNIDTVVISPGNSHNAIVRSLEEDSYFHTYNIVDERSACFFACGLIQELKKPVAICCTAGTAATNYLTGVTEAYRRKLPLVVITGDKNQYYLSQNIDQMVDNVSIFKTVTRRRCILPIINNKQDEWYCQRILNETLLELDHHGTGPIQIDVPIEIGMMAIGNSFTANCLPKFNKINRYDLKAQKEELKSVFERLHKKRVFVMCGQDDHISKTQIELIESVFNRYNCIFGTDKLSNLHCIGTVEVTRAAKRMSNDISVLCPDIVISIAGNPCMDFKFRIEENPITIEHWIVKQDGQIADPFKKLTTVFEGSTLDFLQEMVKYGEKNCEHSYYNTWKKCTENVMIPKLPYSNMYTVQKVMQEMPAGANFNIANSTTVRIAQYFDLDDSIQVYCNRGVNGIDGCASTFIGQAACSPNKLNFLIIGDLTFFYDMNSIWNRYMGKNIRIMLNNNEGAALFHFNQGIINYPTLNENVAAEHFATAKGWVESQGFHYLSAINKAEFDENLPEFLMEDSDKPVFFEVFTHKDEDAKVQHNFYDAIVIKDVTTTTKNSAKKLLKSVLGEDMVRKLKGMR